MKSTSYGSVLGALVKILNDKISTSFKININRHNNLEISTFIFLKARLPFVQSEVYCTLYICSGVAKGYRGEDQALEMDRIVGESFWNGYDGEKLAKWQANKKQTNKQTKMFQISGSLNCFAFMLKIQLLIKYLPWEVK